MYDEITHRYPRTTREAWPQLARSDEPPPMTRRDQRLAIAIYATSLVITIGGLAAMVAFS